MGTGPAARIWSVGAVGPAARVPEPRSGSAIARVGAIFFGLLGSNGDQMVALRRRNGDQMVIKWWIKGGGMVGRLTIFAMPLPPTLKIFQNPKLAGP